MCPQMSRIPPKSHDPEKISPARHIALPHWRGHTDMQLSQMTNLNINAKWVSGTDRAGGVVHDGY